MKKNLLESTGYSYSGISDIVNNEPALTQQLLKEISISYESAKAEQERMEKSLEKMKSQRGNLVSMFVLTHQALGLGDQPLVFIVDGFAVVVHVLDREAHKINYERYPITSTNKHD